MSDKITATFTIENCSLITRGEPVAKALETLASTREKALQRLRGRVPNLDNYVLLTEFEVSCLMSVPGGTLRRWRGEGKGPSWHKVEGSVRYALADVLREIEESKRLSVRANMEARQASAKHHRVR
ncbi:hypothetical protein [Occallatibacter riparius]|uniref:DNA-binding protein n=1 Tax=Occallatibacter riparius TaxID=1002689 RepID=A0A9J7BKX1_9BACT|nr:hypothetical protein [Occallatibacter riparius]UWZ83480.1 hypothetical protein MOP44_23305 [Occallatibacter riparius]